MPDVERLSVDLAVRRRRARRPKLTIPCLALFPYTEPCKRRRIPGSEALNDQNLRLSGDPRRSRKEVPDIGILCDVALDPYTSHGHDGLLQGDIIPQ